VGGATITWNIPSQYEDLKTAYPNVGIVLVNGGVNDVGNAEREGTLESSKVIIKQAMLDYLTAVDNDGKTAVVYTIPYLISPPRLMTQENVDNMNDAIYELNVEFTMQAAGFGFPVFAMDAMMDENREGYYADWVHPTCEAYAKMGEILAVMIEPLLQ
jgi:lysophospholipase L1-like esterase